MKKPPPREAQRLTADSTKTASPTAAREPTPWMLPMQDMPVILQKHGITEGHVWPLVGRRLPDDTVHAWRTSPAKAWVQPLVEWMRTGTAILGVVLDIDTPIGLEHLGAASMSASPVAPTPNMAVYRKLTGHAHGVWILQRPVLRGPTTRPKPLQVLARIAEWMTEALEADPRYRGILVSNPVHDEYDVRWLRTKPYSLAELKAYIPKGWRRPNPPRTDAGRNHTLLSTVLRYAGRSAHSDDDVVRYATQLYGQIDTDRPHSFTTAEFRGLVRSVLRMREQWRRRGWHKPEFLEHQANRARKAPREMLVQKGVRSGEARRALTHDRDQRILQGLESNRPAVVARSENVAESTVRYIRDRAGKTATNSQRKMIP